MKSLSGAIGACTFTVLLAGASPAHAQGFGVYEQSTCAMGRAGAGVAAPCTDGSAVFFNPAALPTDRSVLSVGGILIGPRGEFVNDTTGNVSSMNPRWYPVPNIYYTRPVSKRVAVGAGLFAPYGLTADWPATSEGRFLGYKSLVQGVYMQPTVSVKLSTRVSVGGGIDVTYLNLQLRQRVDLSTQPLTAPGLPAGSTFALLGVKSGTDFADLDLEGHAWHVGYHLGILASLSPKVSIGARFLSEQNVNVPDGTISTQQIATPYVLPMPLPGVPAGTPLDTLLAPNFATGGTLSNQAAQTRMPLPMQFVTGVAWHASPDVLIMADYQFTGWSAFATLPVNGAYLKSVVAEKYRNTHGLRIGTEFAAGASTTLRAGTNLHGAAAPDETVTPNLPEGSRQEFTVGASRRAGTHLRLDLAYLYLHQPDRAGRTTNGGHAEPTVADNNGTYHFRGHLFGASMTWMF